MSAVTWSGAPELRAFLRPIDEVRPHTQNPRRGDVQLVATSLGRFGQQKPCITDRDDHDLIVAGNHTYLAARELGWTHVAVIEMWSGADEGIKYLLMDNATSDNSTYDQQELLSLLDQYDGADLEATGFTTQERDELRASIEEERKALQEFNAGRDDEPAPEPAAPAVLVRNLLITIHEPERWERFVMQLKVLRREWGITDPSACVAEAVRREAVRAHEGAE